MVANIEYAYKEFEKDGSVINTRNPEMPPIRSLIKEFPIGADSTVVELRAADGGLTMPIARLLKNRHGRGEIIACDFSMQRLSEIEQEAEEAGVQDYMDVCCLDDAPPRTLPFDDEGVDSVLSVNMIEYLSDPVPYLAEIFRALSPCGTLLAADWNGPGSSDGDAPKQKGIGPEQLRLMLKAAGFDSNNRIDLPGYAWAFRSVKPKLFTL